MSRKDYRLIAKAIYTAKVKSYSEYIDNDASLEAIRKTLEYVVVNLCSELKYDNASFNRAKFYNAALSDN